MNLDKKAEEGNKREISIKIVMQENNLKEAPTAVL